MEKQGVAIDIKKKGLLQEEASLLERISKIHPMEKTASKKQEREELESRLYDVRADLQSIDQPQSS